MDHQFFIVNRTDKPCERLIAEQVGEHLYYINPELRERWKDRPMSMEDATPVSAFGIEITILEGTLYGNFENESTATYHDGRQRFWQGWPNFYFKYPSPPERFAHED